MHLIPHLPQVGPGWGDIGVLHQPISEVLTLGASPRDICIIVFMCAEMAGTIPKDTISWYKSDYPTTRGKS